MWDKRGPPSHPRAAACPSSPPRAPTFEAPPFSPSVLPRLLLPRDKLSGLPPEWDRVKFRSNSAPSSSAREGAVRHTLITAGVRAPMGDLGQVGGQSLVPHQEEPNSREDSPSSPTPCKPQSPSSNEGALQATLRVATRLRRWWVPGCVLGGPSAPLLALKSHFLDRTHVNGVKNNPSLSLL